MAIALAVGVGVAIAMAVVLAVRLGGRSTGATAGSSVSGAPLSTLPSAAGAHSPTSTTARDQMSTTFVGLADRVRTLEITFPASAGVDALGVNILEPPSPLGVDFGRRNAGNFLEVVDAYCGERESDTDVRRPISDAGVTGFAWCDPVTGFHVIVTGSASFTASLASGLGLRVV